MHSLHRHFECWSRNRGKPRSRPIQNDLIELILIHSRNLIDFFELTRRPTIQRRRRARKDDVIADDYGFPFDPLQIDEIVKCRIDKEIAHLTFARCGLSRKDKAWDFPSIAPELLKRSYKFLRHIHQRFGNVLPIEQAGSVSVLLHDLHHKWA